MLLQKAYKNAFEKKCFQLIIEAYKTSIIEKVIELNWKENDISLELHRLMEENPLRKEWQITTNVEAHIPKDIPKVRGYADKSPRIDFRLCNFISNNEFVYFLEAKNLKEHNSNLKRRYINTGIENFVIKKYENGSLIAYLLEGKMDKTVKSINSLLEKDRRGTEILISREYELLEFYYESTHTSIGKLKHLIFDFTSLKN